MNTLPCSEGGLLLQLHSCFWKTVNEFTRSMLSAPRNLLRLSSRFIHEVINLSLASQGHTDYCDI